MMSALTEHQREAIDAYELLIAEQPALFADRSARPIVRDPASLAAYASDHGVVLGVAAETPYVLFIVDLVESRRADESVFRHPYLRVVSRSQLAGGVNVVVIATLEDAALGRKGDIVLVEQERHALGTSQVEMPRGFGERRLSGEANALRELETETGYVGERAQRLGAVFPDSGLSDAMVSFYHVPVVRRVLQAPELGEAIVRVRLANRDQIWEDIRAGRIRDGFTVQALALYEKFGVRAS